MEMQKWLEEELGSFHGNSTSTPKPGSFPSRQLAGCPLPAVLQGPGQGRASEAAQHGGGQGTINGTVRDEPAARQQVTLYLASPSTFPSEEGLALIRKGGLMEMEKLMAFGTKEGDQI